MKKIDLTHSLSSEIPSWDGSCSFNLGVTTDYADCKVPNLFRVQKIEAKAGIGTHIDAPAHCFPDGVTIDMLSFENLATECVVVHIENADENYKITLDDIEKFEIENGLIGANTFVIFHTGWDQYWDRPEKYRNDLKFPSLHEDTAKLLLKRDIAGIGIDTLSPDAIGNDFPVHRVLLGAGKYIVENVANAKELPSVGVKIMIMPLKIKNGTESPVRLVAMLN